LIFLLSILLPNLVAAQISDVLSATKEMNKLLQRPDFNKSDTTGGFFVNERNGLNIDPEQYVINSDSVTVGLLVKNDTHDFSKYWRGKNRTNSNRYTWVFVMNDFKERCNRKNISRKTYPDLSKRLCRFLGLSDECRRDTIVYMQVSSKSLFRPSYNTNISQRTDPKIVGRNDSINSMSVDDRRWMLSQQVSNQYPWTRMGYTYDWGDANHIGVTEFILRPDTQFTKSGYTVIDDYLK